MTNHVSLITRHMLSYENPVVTKDLRTRMRGAKAHWLMLGYVLLLSTVMLIAYYNLWLGYSGRYSPESWLQARIGLTLFSALTWCQMVLISLIAPSLTAGSVTIEREQLTIEMLSLTSLTPRNIIVGKVTSAMLFILMLLACSLPLAGICLMFGGISPTEVAVAYLLLAGWAFLFASTGVLFSALIRRTSGAVLATFGSVALYGFNITGGVEALNWDSSNWLFIFSGLSAGASARYAMEMAPVFGMKIPVALVGIATELAAGALFLTVAMTHLDYHRSRKPVLIRLLLLTTTLVGLFLFFGNVIHTGSRILGSSTEDLLYGIFLALCIVVMPFIPLFSTGPLGRSPNLLGDLLFGPVRLLGRDLKSRLSKADRPVGGLWFLAIWFAAGCGVAVLTLILASVMPSGTARTADPMLWPNFVEASFALLAAVIGMASIGILASSVLPTRSAAVAVTIILGILAWVALPIMMAQHESAYNYSWKGTNTPIWQVAYLWPGAMLTKIAGDWRQGQTVPALWLPEDALAVGCVLAWALVALAALMIADKQARRGGGLAEE